MDEQSQNRVNALFDNLCHRLEMEVRQAPAQMLPAVSETICTLYALKVSLSNSDEGQQMQIKLMKNINRMMDSDIKHRERGDQNGGNESSTTKI